METAPVVVIYEKHDIFLEADTATQVAGAAVEIPYKQNDIIPPASSGHFTQLLDITTDITGTELWTDTAFHFTPSDIHADTVQAFYRICNDTCKEQCDTSEIIAIYYKIPVGDTQDQVISPNGDGKNEGLAFDFLNDALFPFNQIYIHNRWGSLVYSAAPYENGSWSGQAKNGESLPAGTYYFVLRLEKDESRTVFGNVLILR
jgi:gliding motility-associated-like protein